MDRADSPFVAHRAATPSPVVVEIPHAGTAIDDASRAHVRIPPAALAAGAVRADSDVGAEEIWWAARRPLVTAIVARITRHVIDLNTEPRLPTPAEEKLPAAMRARLVRSQCGHRWRAEPPPRREVERRIRDILEPYHGRIASELQQAVDLHGAAILLSLHTFPESEASGAEVVLGTLGGTSASPMVRDLVAQELAAQGLRVALDVPFPGGLATQRHGRPEESRHALQIEIARGLLCPAGDGVLDGERVQRLGDALAAVVDALSATPRPTRPGLTAP
jgi:N-formylglutamate deformylase